MQRKQLTSAQLALIQRKLAAETPKREASAKLRQEPSFGIPTRSETGGKRKGRTMSKDAALFRSGTMLPQDLQRIRDTDPSAMIEVRGGRVKLAVYKRGA